MDLRQWLLVGCLVAGGASQGVGQSIVGSDTYRRIKAGLDAVPAIDTHDHLWPFDRLPGLMDTDRGRGMTLSGLWRSSYYPQVGALTVRRPGEPFDPWWARAKGDFDNAVKEMKVAAAGAPDIYKSAFSGLVKRLEAKEDINK